MKRKITKAQDKQFHQLLRKLETDFGWSFYDEKGILHLEDLQKQLIGDILRALTESTIEGEQEDDLIPDWDNYREPKDGTGTCQNTEYPSDKEIEVECKNRFLTLSDLALTFFIQGAKWVRDYKGGKCYCGFCGEER